MEYVHNKKLTPYAKALRKNMTREERHLWYDFLRSCPAKFTRQKVLGHYIADFYCAGAKLVIELDGGQHFERTGMEQDSQRDQYLRQLGLTVLRYSNLEVSQNFEGVCQDILRHLPPLQTDQGTL